MRGVLRGRRLCYKWDPVAIRPCQSHPCVIIKRRLTSTKAFPCTCRGTSWGLSDLMYLTSLRRLASHFSSSRRTPLPSTRGSDARLLTILAILCDVYCCLGCRWMHRQKHMRADDDGSVHGAWGPSFLVSLCSIMQLALDLSLLPRINVYLTSPSLAGAVLPHSDASVQPTSRHQ